MNIPSTCSCGPKMDIQHAMSVKKIGVIAIKHNDLRDLTANLCKNVDIVLQLLPVPGETFENQTANTCNDARINIKSRGFSVKSQETFFDAKVLDPNANQYLNKALSRY